MWRRQLQSPRLPQECSEGLCHRVWFCCNLGRWNRSDMGLSGMWWRQLNSPRSVKLHLDGVDDACQGKKFTSQGSCTADPAIDTSRWAFLGFRTCQNKSGLGFMMTYAVSRYFLNSNLRPTPTRFYHGVQVYHPLAMAHAVYTVYVDMANTSAPQKLMP